MDRLLDYADKSSVVKMRNTIALHLLAGTGLKLHEASALLVSDVNAGLGFLTAGKGKKRRTLPLDERTIPLMQQYIPEYRDRYIYQRGGNCAHNNLLVSYYLKPLPRDSYCKLVKAIGRELGLELNPEVIRHSFTYHLWEGDTTLFLQHTGIHALTTKLLDLPEHELDLRAALKKYHPRF